MNFINTIFIAQSLQITFAYTSKPENISAWDYAVIKTEQISAGPLRVGFLYKQKREFPGNVLEDTFEVADLKENSLLKIKSVKAKYPFVICYRFEATDKGTLITNEFHIEGGVFNYLGFLLKTKVKAAVAQNLDTLKSIVEKLQA